MGFGMKTFLPHTYQVEAGRFMIRKKCAALFADPGLGKTATSLMIINGLIRVGKVKKVLVVAPLRVVYSVWPKEVKEWEQFKKLRVSIVHGTPKQREAALKKPADVYLINPEGIRWLAGDIAMPKFGMLIVDESTKFKNPKLKTASGEWTRFNSLRRILPTFEYRYILTGTPTPNTMVDLWSQMYIVDMGERLGKKVSYYLRDYFYPSSDRRKYHLQNGAKRKIEKLIADVVMRLDASKLLDMPPLIERDILVELPPEVRKAYNKLERKLFFEMESKDISEIAFVSSTKYIMSRQIANGGLYVGDKDKKVRDTATVHDAKLEALDDLIEELHEKPLMVMYHYNHELARLKKRYGNVPHIGSGVSGKEGDRIVDEWNACEIPLLLCQPTSMGHGLNMQKGGHDQAWLGITPDFEVYDQAIKRIYRQGVSEGVRIHRILAERTVDESIRMATIRKDHEQGSFLDSFLDYHRELSTSSTWFANNSSEFTIPV